MRTARNGKTNRPPYTRQRRRSLHRRNSWNEEAVRKDEPSFFQPRFRGEEAVNNAPSIIAPLPSGTTARVLRSIVQSKLRCGDGKARDLCVRSVAYKSKIQEEDKRPGRNDNPTLRKEGLKVVQMPVFSGFTALSLLQYLPSGQPYAPF